MFFRLPDVVNDSRIELPSSEDNLPELLIQVPDFGEPGYEQSSRADPPRLPNQPSAKRGESRSFFRFESAILIGIFEQPFR